ncbi:Hemopexin-like repeat [Sesbania bispinosa]|nr:Hemopexin-like repeat [Sesbania bispinosa]
MSIPPNSPCRGCASSFAQPVSAQEQNAAQELVNTVYHVNCRERNPPLANIVYRPGVLDCDILRHLFRWDTRSYEEIFQNGFRARPQEGTSTNTYYDLYDFIQNGGAPLDSGRRSRHGFVSTTLNIGWRPDPSEETLPQGGQIEIYRYEIYAPGGVWVAATLADQYNYPSQDEVCFVAGIAPQYIRSAQLFIATRQAGSRYVRIRRADNILIINAHFSPLSDPYMELLIQMPVFYYIDENGRQRFLSHQTYTPHTNRQKRQVVSNDNWDAALKWYGDDVADVLSYINAAFRSSRTNEAYIFMKNEYALLNYAPGTTDDKIVNGPLLICDGFPSLIGTSFGEYGIDCAFDTDYNKAFIFSMNLCAYIDYAPGTTDDKILSGPMTITAMFPFFKSTVFEKGIDAAFRSTRNKEAYLFRGDQYALINYNSKNLIAIRNIRDGFPSLVGTVFENGIDAAFASHRKDEAYLFKGEYYALINFAPGTTDDYIIGGRVKQILPNWPSLRSILPRKNAGLDFHRHQNHAQDHPKHDEL